MFSHMIGSLFILMMFSLAEQKVFNLIESHLFILSFIYFALEDILVKILLLEVSEMLLPAFFSRTFMVLWFMFKSFIHFACILVYGISWWSGFTFLHVLFQISQDHLLKRLFLLHFMLLSPLSNIN